MTRRCWISCAGRPRARNTSPRSARDRWCWARPACCKATARRRTGRRWIFLRPFGATPTKTRVCVDRNRVTGGGVTAGIDFALTLVSILVDRPDRGGDPAPARIQSGAAVQRRLARHRAAGNSRVHEREDRARASAPQRGDRSRRRAARLTQPNARNQREQPKKKAAWFPRRPFLSYGSSTLTGDFRTSCTGGLSPSHVLIGSRCIIGAVANCCPNRRDGLHLRKMGSLSHESVDGSRTQRQMSPLSPLFTGGSQ